MIPDARITFTPESTGENVPWTGDVPLIVPEPWMQDAVCASTDPDLFFPTKGDHATAAQARKICASCPVAAQCREFAVRTRQQHGVWGGTTPRKLTQGTAA